MVFGSFCYKKDYQFITINPRSIRITGIQKGFVQSFEIYQSIFSIEDLNEVSYVFPTDNKICIYSMHFMIGDEIIPAELRSKTQAKEIYDEAKKEGKTAVMTSQNCPGITSIAIGNVPKNKIVAIIFKCSFTSLLENNNTILTKIPLKSYNSNGTLINFNKLGSFGLSIEMTISQMNKISDVYSNFDCEYVKIDDCNGKLIINTTEIKEENIMIHTKFEDQIKSQMIQTEKATIVSLIPEFETINSDDKELVFLIDCSGSMNGESIRKAKETLSMFISKLSNQIYFNIICFGSTYIQLFDQSLINSKENNEKAAEFIEKINANLGGTRLSELLSELFNDEVKISCQRQIFLITDGEVEERDFVVDLIRKNSVNNRIFAIGLGRGSDAGFLEEITAITFGKYDLILNEDELPNIINEHFELSKTIPATNTELHIEGNDSFQVVPHPLPPLLPHVLQHIFISTTLPIDDLIITAKLNNSIDIENIISCKSQLDEKMPIFALFAQQQLREIQSDEEKSIELSMSSGVLSKYTSYIAVSKEIYIEDDLDEGNYNEEIRNAYCLYDNDDTGKISFEQLKKICKDLGEDLDDDEIQEMVDEYNSKNEDENNVSEEEFIRVMSGSDIKITENKDVWNKDSSCEDILNLQFSEGFWELSSSFIDSKTKSQLSIGEIDLTNLPALIRNRIISIILAICYLEKFYNNDKSKWMNAREKSLKWLSEINDKVNWEQIITCNMENILQ